jgi:hypothetical protein
VNQRKNFEFFFKHAGYIVGERAKGALNLARAEQYAEERGWSFDWTWDDNADSSWMDEKERERDHEALGCILRDENGEVIESLWGIFDPDENYRRVVQAELASQAMYRDEQLSRAMAI